MNMDAVFLALTWNMIGEKWTVEAENITVTFTEEESNQISRYIGALMLTDNGILPARIVIEPVSWRFTQGDKDSKDYLCEIYFTVADGKSDYEVKLTLR